MKRATKKYKSEKSYNAPTKIVRVPRGLNRELKTMDATFGNYTSSTTTIASFINIAEGSSQGQRIGRRVQIYSISIRVVMSLSLISTTPTTSDEIRFSLILDRQPNLALPVITDIRATNGANAFPNANTTKRFKVLSDTWHPLQLQLGGTGITGQATEIKTHNIYVKKNIIVEWQNSNADYTGISTNNLLCVYNSQTASAVTGCYCDCRARIKYYDD